jgi:transposase-like protein
MMEYSELVRARSVRRMLGPGAISATELSRETGIPQPTLSRWLRGAGSLRLVSSKPETPSEVEPVGAEKRPQDWSPMERMQFVLDAHGLGEQELGELLRRRGVHREQLDAWRAAAEGFGQPTTSRRSPESKRIKELEREVARKDKALAETAALLVLQKKLQLLFPEGQAAEDDDTDEGSDK